jgi:hypothetical protein
MHAPPHPVYPPTRARTRSLRWWAWLPHGLQPGGRLDEPLALPVYKALAVLLQQACGAVEGGERGEGGDSTHTRGAHGLATRVHTRTRESGAHARAPRSPHAQLLLPLLGLPAPVPLGAHQAPPAARTGNLGAAWEHDCGRRSTSTFFAGAPSSPGKPGGHAGNAGNAGGACQALPPAALPPAPCSPSPALVSRPARRAPGRQRLAAWAALGCGRALGRGGRWRGRQRGRGRGHVRAVVLRGHVQRGGAVRREGAGVWLRGPAGAAAEAGTCRPLVGGWRTEYALCMEYHLNISSTISSTTS